jgi:hypothetical protein
VVASLRGCGRSPAMTFPSFRGPIPLERHLGDLGNLYLPFCTEIYGYLHSHSMILRPRETGRAPHTYCGSRLRAATAKRLQVDGLNHHAKTRIYALSRSERGREWLFRGLHRAWVNWTKKGGSWLHTDSAIPNWRSSTALFVSIAGGDLWTIFCCLIFKWEICEPAL